MNSPGAFFDLYGTLLLYGDMNAAWSDWLTALYKSLQGQGVAGDRQWLAEHCDGFFSRPEPPIEPDGLTVYERRIGRLCRDIRLEVSKTDLSQAAQVSIEAWHQYISLDPNSIPLLSQLSNNRILALISNFDYPPQVYVMLSKFGLDKFFDVVVISGEVGISKPDPGIFDLALQRTDADPVDTVYVGDTLNDVSGALASGLRPILIDRPSDPRTDEATEFRINREAGETNAAMLARNMGAIVVRSLAEVATVLT
ncbi:MAG: HAD family hydrolase [candidate division Zixibacteria bacterium]|nr:HAD family hydrolase [candidate division Zixibacteria bacterium]